MQLSQLRMPYSTMGSHLCEKINEPSISQPIHTIIAGYKYSEGAWSIQYCRQATVLQKTVEDFIMDLAWVSEGGPAGSERKH